MTQYEKDLSNISYTNKDFQTIYPELLDLVTKISYKWNPVESDESDPGVVLLKLVALMADKNNYNIDKNILELFPLSVTQEPNARQLFEQCGYCMKYYQSATGNVVFSMTAEPEITDEDLSELSPTESITTSKLDNVEYTRKYIIPMFTMISDLENNIVYTTTRDAIVESNQITTDPVPVIQGIVNHYSVNGETLLTPMMLDYKNRLYFTETNVAENGIFIRTDLTDYSDWKKVDNLFIQPAGSYCYKFGVTEDGSMCYVEFPDDIDSIVGGGFYLSYIRTSGFEGNIGKKRLCQFYNDVTSTRYIVDRSYSQDVVVTANNIYPRNIEAISNGKNPETIDEAYRNYQKVKCTFETLVSLRDYNNYIFTSKYVSNGYVCDRTNDIQSVYKIVETTGSNLRTHTMIIKDEDGNPDLNAFQLKVYGFLYVDNPLSDEAFRRSFTLMTDNRALDTPYARMLEESDHIKCLYHEYGNYKKNEILMIKNKYPIIAKLIPHYKLTLAQQDEVLRTVVAALYNILNSRALNFGEQIDYSTVYDTISDADPRIKAVVLDEIEYETYAEYSDGTSIQEIRIDSESEEPNDKELKELWNKFRTEIYSRSVLAGVTQLYHPDNEFNYSIQHRESKIVTNITKLDTNADIEINFEEEKDNTGNPTGRYIGPGISDPLKDNENVLFTASNLITDQQFSSYVKVIYNINFDKLDNKEIPANSEYTLQPDTEMNSKNDEYIVFFWKADDDEDSPYQWYKYSCNSTAKVICPSFTLKPQPDPNDRQLPGLSSLKSILSSWKPGKGKTSDERTSIHGSIKLSSESDQDVTMSVTDYVSQLSGSSYVLTGTRSIEAKKENTIEITNPTNGTKNIFWITNNEVPDIDGNMRCVLFPKGVTTYTLKSNEYLIYSNASKTQLVMLSEGTLLKRGHAGASWDVEAIDYDEFLANGLDYLDEKWFDVSSDQLWATEMTFYQLGPGNSIKLTPTSNSAILKPDDIPQKIVFTNSGAYACKGSVKTEMSSSDLANYSISYIDEMGIETSLPARNNENSWEGRSILNLDVSNGRPQILEDNQKLIFTCSEEETTTTIEITGPGAIQTSREIALTGGTDLDATTYDLQTKSYVPLDAYFYVSNEDIEDIVSYHNNFVNSFVTTIIVYPDKPQSKEIDLSFMAPVGNYLIPIFNSDNFSNLTFTANGQKLVDVDNIDKYHQFGNHFLKLTIKGQNGLNVGTVNLHVSAELALTKVTPESPEEYLPTMITISTLYRYDNEVDETIMHRTYELDPDRVFDYTYDIPEDILIEDPLEADSFFDENHVFNPFTMGEWETSSKKNKMIVTNKIK